MGRHRPLTHLHLRYFQIMLGLGVPELMIILLVLAILIAVPLLMMVLLGRRH